MKSQWIFIAACMMAGSVFMAGCKKKEESVKRVSADTTMAIHVVTTVVEPRTFEDWGTYSADLRGSDDVVLTAPMAGGGRVDKVSEVGGNVSKGDALCDIESERYHALALQAQSAQDLAQGELDRTKNNVEKGYVGKAMMDKAQLDYQSARVAVLQTQRAYQDSRCEAPFSGVLVSRFVDAFQNVAPGTPTVRVANLSSLEAVVSIPESEAFDYHEGQKAEFELLQGNGGYITGRIRGLDRAVEVHNRTVMARIELPNPGGRLRPGMVGRARILRKGYDKALVLASQAVLRLQEGTAVMLVLDGRAHKSAVVLGPSRADSVVVLSGISAGDRVITVGAFQVSENTKVEF